jgi:hypothetical protein
MILLRVRQSVLLLLLFVCTDGFAQSLIREEQAVLVDGVMEKWRLEWSKPPEPWCDVLDGDWESYPCEGFAYGEAGELDLVRYRGVLEYERLHLTPLSTAFPDKAVLQRWPVQPEDHDHRDPKFYLLNSPERAALLSRVRGRPTVKIMALADYDHDGNATEFFLQTEAGAFHRWGVVVGVSRRNPHLHAFGTALHPDTPLVLQPHEWEALLRNSGAVRVMDWKCPDHGATTDVELELTATPTGIRVISRTFECGRRRLIEQSSR